MAITSISEAKSQYLANFDWENDATKAAAAKEALMYLKLYQPEQYQFEGQSGRYNSLEAELKALNAFISRSSFATGPQFRRLKASGPQ